MSQGIEDVFDSEDEARAAAKHANLAIPPRPKTAHELLEILSKAMCGCLYCGEYGCGGRVMECGFEVLAPRPHHRGRGLVLVRERCMLRSWIEAEVTGRDPLESALGTAEEWLDVDWAAGARALCGETPGAPGEISKS